MIGIFSLVASLQPAPLEAGSMTLAEMVRGSDVIVVATVEEVVDRPLMEPTAVVDCFVLDEARLGTARVESWIKGPPQDDPLVFLNQGTWTCDVTGAEAGERALFFFQREPRDHRLQDSVDGYALSFGERALLHVVHSGRGQMGLRHVAGEELATYWEYNVRLPEGAPLRPGPEPEYEFIRSVRLDWLVERISAEVEAQRATMLRAIARAGPGSGAPWELTLRRDRTATLVVRGGGGEIARELTLDGSSTWEIDRAIEEAGGFRGAGEIGSGPWWDRTLVLALPEGERRVEIGRLSGARGDPRAVGCAKLWTALVAAIDDPGCADHRPADAALSR